MTAVATAARDLLPLAPDDALLAQLERVYQDLHANPELSMQEVRTAGIAADWLRRDGFEVITGVGRTGVVGVLRNGDGPVVLLRADMDALPLVESTGLPYASRAIGTDRFGQATGIAHACGHDMHVAWLMGACRVFAENARHWTGTLVAVFQPGEETAQGADAMIADGLTARIPKPDIVLAQHVIPAPAGAIAWRSGAAMAIGDSWEVKLFGRGAHGSQPQKSIDPVLMAASAVMRLQGVVSRETAMTDGAVLTVGTLRAGTNENVIPDEALLRLNVRTFKQEVRTRVLAAIRRILEAEAAASGAPKPPEFSVLSAFQPVINDPAETGRIVAAFERRFGADRVQELPQPTAASEDFSAFGPAFGAPSVYWFVGGTDAAQFAAAAQAGTVDALPSNHAPDFAPVVDPTLRAGIEAMLTAAGVWLMADGAPT
ncbi:MAG: amidohydrolase [Rhodospirillales bacterium 69-11]|nr:MAG: amidohydrolase [Rhodospirillales bacterium 69-11]